MILFVFIPRNHIARFAIWIYAVGLPCFAVVAGRIWRRESPLFRYPGKIWVVGCIVIAVLEGLYSFSNQDGLRDSVYQSEGEGGGLSIARISDVFSGKYSADYVWPRLQSSIFEEVFSGAETVALSRITEATGKNRILGHLTQQQAFGKRPIYFFDLDTVATDGDRLRDFIESRNIRYIIWDTDEPLPRELARQVDGWDRVNGRFYLLEFDHPE